MRKINLVISILTIFISPLLINSNIKAQSPLTFDSVATFQFGTFWGTDCWGYTTPGGEDYAIMGISTGIVFVNVTTLTVVDTVTGSQCGWQDMATWGQYCYAVSECGTGLRVIDMQYLPDSVQLVGIFPTDGGGGMGSHNLSIDSVAGFIYLEGGVGANSAYIHSLSNPANPVFVGGVGKFGGSSLHDVYAYNDTAYLAEGGNGEFSIWDMADKQNPVMLTSVSFPGSGFLHNIWPTDDRRFVVTTEETAGQTIKIWNIEDFNNVFLAAEVLGGSNLAHNVQVEGDFLYVSHYESGVLLYDIFDPANPVHLATFDSWPQGEAASFSGNWGVYPHSPNGYVYASNRDGKLYVLRTPVSQSYPSARGFNLGADQAFHVVNHFPSFFWSFDDTIGTASGYEIEVGIDNEWTVAENWASGQVFLSDTTASYGGSALVDGVTYFLRIRVHNGIEWGKWRLSSFRLNSIPSVPVPRTPTGSFAVVSRDVILETFNSTDAESDNVSYDIELYADAGMTTLIAADSALVSGNSVTKSTPVNGLSVGSQYWWRSRAFDGFEYSGWSSLETFVVRSPRAFTVPTDFSSINIGVDSAQYGDTLVVSPGLYQGNLSLGNKELTITSSQGATKTMLQPLISSVPLILVDPGGAKVELSGFTIGANNTRTAIQISGGADVHLHHNTFRDFNILQFMINVGNSTALIEQNLFVDNNSEYCVHSNSSSGNVTVVNNTFDNNKGAMASTNSQAIFMNNIVVNTSEIGVNGVFGIVDYNDFWGNNTDYVSVSPGLNDIAADPLFVDAAGENYSLQAVSLCIDAGNPDTTFNDPDGSRSDIGAFSSGVITDVDDDPDGSPLPITFNLAQNYPNPFNPSTVIEFALPERSDVSLDVFNLLGQQVSSLVSRELPAGDHSIVWDGRDDALRPVSSGVYFYRLVAGENRATRKMVLLK